jgi:hypothetical protein
MTLAITQNALTAEGPQIFGRWMGHDIIRIPYTDLGKGKSITRVPKTVRLKSA